MRTDTAGAATDDTYDILFESQATGSGTDGPSAHGFRIRCNHATNSIKVRCMSVFGDDEHVIAPADEAEEFFDTRGISKIEVANAAVGDDSSYDMFAITIA